MIVVDASVLVEVILQSETAGPIEARLLAETDGFHAPHLIDLEVANVVRRYAAAQVISELSGDSALAVLADFPLQRHEHTWLLPRIWMLRHNVSAYDAAYIALAEMLEAPLLTRDGRLSRAPGHRARVEVI